MILDTRTLLLKPRCRQKKRCPLVVGHKGACPGHLQLACVFYVIVIVVEGFHTASFRNRRTSYVNPSYPS